MSRSDNATAGAAAAGRASLEETVAARRAELDSRFSGSAACSA